MHSHGRARAGAVGTATSRWLGVAALLASTAASGQTVVKIDASEPPPPLRSAHLHMGTATGPGGTIGVNSLYLTRDGKPWTLTALPLRSDAPIYLDDSARTLLPATGQVADLRTIRVVPEYTLGVRAR
ncbi:hypothetical protein [Sphingomonas sp. AAP5]|uniref:hypothetical protein n=1 Tax=Sphingomonas sp. AAP5 TaxID=1523415 RepID=UPI00140469FE|nr:hypothetical protein [Sphingomonas sp. AAP5]